MPSDRFAWSDFVLELTGRRPQSLCDGIGRRSMLGIGALGPLGMGAASLGLNDLLAARAAASPGDGPRAKRMILLFMWGGPAHQDTWDLKPEGPAEHRGEFLPIATKVPGLHVSEHLPHLARHADKLAVIRSVGQEDNNHSTGAHAGLTGRKHERQAENFSATSSDFPHFGSVLSKLRPNDGGMPTFVALPDVIATTAGKITPGQGGGILGAKYDPFRITDHPDEPDFSIRSLRLPGGLSLDRMRERRSLLDRVDDVARLADRSAGVEAMDAFYERALDMVISPRARAAFRLEDVPNEERWRYGWHTFGQSCLLARRLVEAGVQIVTVYWHRERPTIDSSWDTHQLNHRELRNRLLPAVDRTVATLLEDLDRTGLLDETLVVWNSEFGRTPRINGNAGRDHWGPCNSVVMAGGGVPGGQVYGATDASAAYPTADKVTQDDIAATIYRQLGFDPHATTVPDRLGRPHALALGEPIWDVLGGRSAVAPSPLPTTLPTRPRVGSFARLLRSRARRHLHLDVGQPESEAGWSFTGWSAATGTGDDRHRVVDGTATLKRDVYFHAHFDYGVLAIRLTEPRSIESVGVTINGRSIPMPEDGASSAFWQVPLPVGFVKTQKAFELRLTAADWRITDLALLGDAIVEPHLSRYLAGVDDDDLGAG